MYMHMLQGKSTTDTETSKVSSQKLYHLTTILELLPVWFTNVYKHCKTTDYWVHYHWTVLEIWEKNEGRITAFVDADGTDGTSKLLVSHGFSRL